LTLEQSIVKDFVFIGGNFVFSSYMVIKGGVKKMKNHVLGITGSVVPYYKDLNKYTGSVTATILMTQLEYWFSKMGGKSTSNNRRL